MRDACNILLNGRYDLSCLLRSACRYDAGLIPASDIATVITELRAIRTVAPEVGNIHASCGFKLTEMLATDLRLPVSSASTQDRETRNQPLVLDPMATGIPLLDELNMKFGVARIDATRIPVRDDLNGERVFRTCVILLFHFDRPLNIAAVAEIYGKKLGGQFQPNFIYRLEEGGWSKIERVRRNDRSLRYRFAEGSFDLSSKVRRYSCYQFNVFPQAEGFLVERSHDSGGIRSSRGYLMPDCPNLEISATDANLESVSGVAVDKAGNVVFSSSQYNAAFRVDSSGLLTVVAGNGTQGYAGDNGRATSAWLSCPRGVAVDEAGDIYIADLDNDRVRRVSNGVITTIAGDGTQGFSGDIGPAINAQLTSPTSVATSGHGLYIVDRRNFRIRKVSNGTITTVAGYGTGALIPAAVAVDKKGVLYIADDGNHRVLKLVNDLLTTIAGNGTAGFSGDDGPATNAQLNGPSGIAVDDAGNLYIADTKNHRIRKVSNGVITTVAGNGQAGFSGDNGPVKDARLTPGDIAVDSAFNLYIADLSANRIRKVSEGIITTVAGNGGLRNGE